MKLSAAATTKNLPNKEPEKRLSPLAASVSLNANDYKSKVSKATCVFFSNADKLLDSTENDQMICDKLRPI